ncbi:MAG TPA: heterodisulfide reductase-related iron-sulfur binding cluster [Candidatus Limnocylindria bacterium]|nr:heterodisulfide reductase-related iron-sulfur binding cluster [Candidatus Limnocylindria bacterium]
MTIAPLREVEPGLRQCIHCGMCLEACPTYQITRLETESPRGRIHLMIDMLEGGPTSDATRLHLDRCLACRACEVVCPSGVPYGHLIEAARTVIAEEVRPRRGWLSSRLRRLALDLLADPASLGRAAAILALYQRLGLRALVHATGLARALPRGLRRLEALYPPFARPRYRAPAIPSAPRARVALLLGCVMRVAYGDIHTAAARILARQGIAVIDAPAQTCCGALHAHAGEREDARALARRNIAAFEDAAVDAVVVDAAGCGAQLKGYAALLADDAGWSERAAAFAAKVRDVNEYLAEIAGERLGRLDLRATYQDPCHLAHAQGIRAQPRELLSRVRGLELIEMIDADVCCGSAGSYNITQPDYSDRLLARKVDAILATGAGAVVSANPGCMLQIEAGLRARGSRLPVLHVVEVLDRAMS